MAAHRAWRLAFDTSGNGFCAAAGLRFKTQIGGPDVLPGATGVAISDSDFNSPPNYFPKARAFDANPATFWASNRNDGKGWIGWDFGAGNALDIIEFDYQARPDSDSDTQAPRSGGLEYSDDLITWTRAFSIPYSGAYGPSVTRTFSNFHRAWRLKSDATLSGFFAVAALRLKTAVGGADVTSGATGNVIADSDFSGLPRARAFDNNATTFWASGLSNGQGWIGWDFGAGNTQSIVEFDYQARPDTDSNNQAMRPGGLEYSDDLVTWYRVLTTPIAANWAASEIRTYRSTTSTTVAAPVNSGSGSSAGKATVSGSGSSSTSGLVTGTGSSAGVATVAGQAGSIASGSGSAAGAATVTGQSPVTVEGSGAAAGAATANAQGSNVVSGAGAAAGQATVGGEGSAGALGKGASAGKATVAGRGTGVSEGGGSSAGAATVEGSTPLVSEGAGAAAGQAVVDAYGSVVQQYVALDLPVWTIRPNWSQGILERLEWLTDVLASETGVEQRRSVRLSPRRSFEMTVNPSRRERTYLDLALHRLGSEEWLLPLWHDQAALSAPLFPGGDTLYIENTFREFLTNGYAILYASAFEWEVIQIGDQAFDRLLSIKGVTKEWPRGTKVYPLRRATLPADTNLKALTSRVGESVLLFQVNEANDYPEALGDDMVVYNGSPLLTREPNRSQAITTDHTRLADDADGEIGLRYRVDTVGRAFAVQSHNWMIQGRENQASFRSFLYTLRGRQRMVWLPSFNDDLYVSRAIAQGATEADIEAIGLDYLGSGSPIPGRSRFWTGTEVLQHASMKPALSTEEERLGLLTGTTASYALGATWGFLEAARLNQDSVELHHHTDSEGVMECAATFKTFANDRDSTGSNFEPIPVSEMTPGECGAPLGLNPCRYVTPTALYMTATFSADVNPCNPQWSGLRHIDIEDVQPNGPGGKSIGLVNLPFGAEPFVQETFENEDDNNPNLRGQLLLRISQTDFNNATVEFFFPCVFLGGYMKPSARYCGSVGKDEGLVKLNVSYPGGGFTQELPAGGNYDMYFEP